jgi:uncharacterized protein
VTQSLPLAEQLKNLIQLQELDLKIDALKKNLSLLPIDLKTLDDSLSKLRATDGIKKNRITELEKSRRQTSAAKELNQDRLTRSNAKLESVQNTHEFQAATKEIEQLKKLNQSLEEQDKKTEEELEGLQKEAAVLDEQIQKSQAQRDEQASFIAGKNSELNSSISTLLSERNNFASKVERRILAQYDRVRGARAGIGIVPAVGGRCKGCNMVVPPQLYNEIQRATTLHSCPSCHRILFVAPPSQSPSQSDVKAID